MLNFYYNIQKKIKHKREVNSRNIYREQKMKFTLAILFMSALGKFESCILVFNRIYSV
jgi:hypothetical protein